MAANRLDQLLEQWDPVLRRAFLSAVAVLRDRARIGLIAERLERGDVAGALEAVGLDPAAFRSLDAAISQTFEAGGVYTTQGIPALREPDGYRVEVLFNVRNPRAEGWLRDHSGQLIDTIIADQRQTIRQHLAAGMEQGENPRNVALDLVGRISKTSGRREGGVIGLTTSQEEWARRYAEELAENRPAALKRSLRDKRFDRSVVKAIREGKPLPAEIRAKMIVAYRNRALRLRAETIARTEAMAALHQSAIEGMDQAIDAGQVQIDQVTRVWHATRDRRTRDTHRQLHGRSVPLAAAGFVSSSGALIRYPGDPQAPPAETINCRCWMELRIDHLRGLR